MKRNEWALVAVIITAIGLLFFHQTIFYGKVPFPGDIIVSDFQPWRSTSYLGYGAGGIPNKAQYPDTIRQMYPWKTLAVESLKRGTLPLWNPYNFSGSPLLANFQSAALYPFGLLYLVLPQIDAWTILIILQPLLAVVFTYFYSKTIGMDMLAGWLTALSYGFSGFMAVWLEYNTIGHVVLWLPLMLLSIEHLKGRPSKIWLAILTLSHTSALLAGHPQVYAYTLVFSLLYTLFRADSRMWMYIFGFSALGIGIGGLQILPGIELIINAARSPHDSGQVFAKILIRPWQLLSLPFPNIFGNPATRTYWPTDTFIGKVTTIGLVPLFFSLSAFRRKDRITTWYIFATVITLLLITSNPITYFLYRIPIPLFTSSSPTLMSFLFAFTLSVTCGLGLNFWLTDTHSTKKLLIRSLQVIGLFGLLALGTKLPITPELSLHAPVALRALMYGTLVSIVVIILFWIAIQFPKYRIHAITLLLLVHIFDLFIFFKRFNPFVPKALVFPQHTTIDRIKDKNLDRYWGYGTANIAANFASQYHIYSPEGYDPLYPKWYGEFLYAYRNGTLMEIFDDSTRSDAAISSRFGDGGLSDMKKQKILSALSVRYILDRVENAGSEQTYPPDRIKRLEVYDDWAIYENTQALPRVYMAENIVAYSSPSDFSNTFFSTQVSSTSAFLPSDSNVISSHGGNARIQLYTPERVQIVTESTASGLLIVTDTFYPGWTATIDDRPAEIIKTNWTMRGVRVPEGTHTVTMIYTPKTVRYGALLSILSLGATIITLLFLRKKTS